MKFALVTGGSRGIGRAISIRLAEMGYNILVNYQSNTEQAEMTKALIEQKNVKAELLKFNVAEKKEIEDVLGKWIDSHEGDEIEILVNNAGIRKDNLLMFMTDEEWHSVLDTSMNGFFYITRLVIKNMLVKKYGRIINVVSLSGLKGLPGQTNYSASKAGIIGATKALAQEVGRRGITVNAVAPGFINSDMTKDLNEKDFKSLIPVNRFGEPEEVAHAVGFLASREASYITAQVLSINGGLYS